MSQIPFGRRRALLVGLALALAQPMALTSVSAAGASSLQQQVVAPDGTAGSSFGQAVAIDGTTLVVGAPATAEGAGAVYVFERTADSWTHVAKLTATDAGSGDSLGASVALEGDTIVAGAPGDTVGAGSDQGSVYTFARAGAAARTETARLTASDGAADDKLGTSVALDGDTIVAGAPEDQVGANTLQGTVYTFARTGPAARTETAKLTASDGAAFDNLGWSVAVDGDTIVAGARYDDVAASSQGSVYTFARTGAAARTETAKLTASDGAGGDRLGTSVAIAGDTIVVGAPMDDVDGTNSQGSVYTFARSGAAARTETAKLTASDGALDDNLGDSVAVAGETVVAGARGSSVGTNGDQGAVYAFARTGSAARTETAKLTASNGAADDELGGSVAVGVDAIVAGARFDDVGTNTDQGSASVFFTPAPPAPDTTAPDTTGLKGPKKVVQGKVAKFRFSSSEPGSTFRCKVDKKRWKDCAAPYKVKTSKLKVGKHTLRVVAVDAAGNLDPSPAKKTFRVLPR